MNLDEAVSVLSEAQRAVIAAEANLRAAKISRDGALRAAKNAGASTEWLMRATKLSSSTIGKALRAL